MYYLQPPSNLATTVNLNEIDLDWTASADTAIAGYNMYRKLLPNGLWSKVNTATVMGTTFIDTALSSSGDYEYMVKTVELKVNASGSFYNESLGITDNTTFVYSVPGIDGLSLKLQIAVFPNPTPGSITISSNTIMEQVILRDLLGRTVLQQTLNVREVSMDLSYFKRGIYTASIYFEDGRIRTEKIILR